MSSVYDFYLDRAEEFSIDGKSNEFWVLTRRGRTMSATAMNNEKLALLPDNTNVSNGDIVTHLNENIKYIVLGRQSSIDSSRAQLHKVNATIDIVKLVDKYVGTNKVGQTEQMLYSSQSAVQTVVSAQVHLYDPGLLATTTNKFIIKNLDIQKLDRIKFNGVNYQIDAINNVKYENALELQCSIDNRKVVV